MTLDAWADIAREVMLVYPWAWLPFIVFVIVTGFVVVNLMIAVICDSIAALHDDEKAKLHGMYNDLSERNSEEEMHPALAGGIQEQLDSLEDQVDGLSRMQEETIMALETLTHRLQIQRTEKEEAST
jgi:TolA-binding protein